MNTQSPPPEPIENKILQWLGAEGYPLEFFTAHAFRKSGFHVTQSDFVKDANGKVREIDVTASFDARAGESLIRIEHVVECKWSKDKPWLLFKDDSRVATSALAAQVIANRAGEAVAWMEAGATDFRSLSIFAESGFSFSGRQAFTKDSDRFYQSAQSVISNCVSVAEFYNSPIESSEHFPIISICLPLIVLDGEIFEVSSMARTNHYNWIELNIAGCVGAVTAITLLTLSLTLSHDRILKHS